LLNLSNVEIVFCKSKYYVRIAGLIHIFAAVVLLHSSLSMILMYGLFFVLFINIVQIVRKPNPLHLYSQLTGHKTHWILHRWSGDTIRYEKVRICFDGGLFIVLQLSADGLKKKLLIFKDQLSTSQHRMLHVITKIGRS
jgi:hypothetical protein